MTTLPARLRSLDAFRGATIAGMILVNNPGSWEHVYPALLHAPWHGWTPTDLIFPFFLFIVGVAIPFSLGRRVEAGTARGALFLKVLRRSAILIGLGLFMAAWPFLHLVGDLGSLRLPGVLQRIGVVYLVAGAAFLWMGRRGLAVLTGACLIGFAAVMRFVPAPGGVAGDLEPGTNLAAYLDSLLLPGTLYQGTWDPEGVLSTVPAIASALLGIFCGQWLRSKSPPFLKTTGMLTAGFTFLTLGWIWSFWLPINKNLWTSSYVLFTAGIALCLLPRFVLIMDLRKPPRWTLPLESLGKNAILAFVGSGLVIKTMLLFPERGDGSAYTWTYEVFFASWLGPLHGSFGFALANVAAWTAIAVWLDRKRIYLKV